MISFFPSWYAVFCSVGVFPSCLYMRGWIKQKRKERGQTNLVYCSNVGLVEQDTALFPNFNTQK